MKKFNNYAASLIFTILTTFFIIFTVFVRFAGTTVMNEKFYTDIVKSEKLTDSVLNSINKFFDDSYASSGIPAEVYLNAIDKDKLESAICNKIENTILEIKGEKVSDKEVFDFSEVEKSITNYFEAFAEENNVDVNEKYQEQLDKTIKAAKTEIENHIDIFMLDVMERSGVLDKAEKLYPFLTPVMIAVISALAVCIVILAVLNRKSIPALFYWGAVSCLCSSVIVAVPCLILKFSDYFNGLVIRTDYIFKSVTAVLYSMVDALLLVQIIIFAAAVILFVLYAVTGRLKKS